MGKIYNYKMAMNKKVIIGLLIAIGLLSYAWTTNKPANTAVDKNSAIRLITPLEFSKLAKNKDALVLDVHIPEQTHIPGTSAFIPYNKITENKDKLPKDKTTPILVYCRSGSMSADAAKQLALLGYSQVYDLVGGTNAYKESNVSVSLSPKEKALGTVIYGEIATTTFTLTNYAPLPLKITRISTSCGCTKASVESKELGAYNSTIVNVSFDPAVHKDDTDLGDLSRTIYIETDSPNYPRLEGIITATVIKKQ
ncbi:DUF1573 domain-containing protein [Patescibacteria group bacterium]|nr:DUF1573 domain-containing protein [Patescibacteria group bacterium]